MNFLGKFLNRNDRKVVKKSDQRSFHPELKPRRSFGGLYDIKKVLGQGSFATVQLVQRKEDGVEFAAKVIAKDRRKKRLDDKALLGEVSILTKVRHRNLVSLVDFFETDDNIILIMDLASGGELFNQIEERGSFTERDAAEILRQLLEAVEYLHALGIAHRDLKPENVLMKTPAIDSEVVITDFGLSRIVDDDDHILHTTCGSPLYVAPEVLKKDKGYGRPVDCWSLGVITYILLCGYAPFWGDDQAQLFSEIMSCRYEFDEEHWSQVSENAKDFIRKLLHPDPDKRSTATAALKHVWLEQAHHHIDLLPTVKKNFSGKRSFRKAANAIRLMNRLKHAADNHHQVEE